MSAETLSAMSDAELSEVFAVEVAQTHVAMEVSSKLKVFAGQRSYGRHRDGAFIGVDPKGGGYVGAAHFESFATDANAVLPFMPKEKHGAFWTADGGFLGVRICIRQQDEITCEGRAPTFARAACIALVLAKRKASK